MERRKENNKTDKNKRKEEGKMDSCEKMMTENEREKNKRKKERETNKHI